MLHIRVDDKLKAKAMEKLSPFVRATEQLDRLTAALDMVVESSDVVGGVPVIRGTRVPVHDVAASSAAGIPLDRILAAYPGLCRKGRAGRDLC
jgi:uncharacterized protein (DUF433 family)